MAEHNRVKITQELKDRVIRAYTEKEMSFNIIEKFICNRRIAEEIIRESGIEIEKYKFGTKLRGFNLGKSNYPTYWEELQKKAKSGNN